MSPYPICARCCEWILRGQPRYTVPLPGGFEATYHEACRNQTANTSEENDRG